MTSEDEMALMRLREERLRKRREKEMQGWNFRMDYWVRIRLILLFDWLSDHTEWWDALSRKFDGWSELLAEQE
jgi:hypothetical protein